MKALHLLKTSHGAAWAVRQMRELVLLGVEVHAAMPHGGARIEECRQAGVIVHILPTDFPTRRPWALPRILSNLRRLVAQVDPDVIHSHFVGTTLVMRLATGRHPHCPRVFQVPGPLHLEHGVFGAIEIALAVPRDHWIASCRWTEQKYQAAGIPRDRVHLSFYGTDIMPFNQGVAGTLRQTLKVDEHRPLIGMIAYMYPPKHYLGQFRGLKGHEDFFAAMVHIRQRCPEALAVVVGCQWGGGHAYEQRLQRMARRLLGDAVVFLGHQSEIPSLYADLNVAVHPSLSENLGGAVESLLAGVPTVATQVGGFPDIISPGKTGWLVPPRCPEQLAQAVLQALHNPLEARCRALAGQANVRTMLDVRRTTREVLAIYEKVLAIRESNRPDRDVQKLQSA